MADLQETMGAIIRRERRDLGLTLKELAERAVLSVVYLGEIERGKKYPSALVLERLAGALELDVSDLLSFVADELRGVQPRMLTAPIGFAQAQQRSATPQPARSGQILNMLVA